MRCFCDMFWFSHGLFLMVFMVIPKFIRENDGTLVKMLLINHSILGSWDQTRTEPNRLRKCDTKPETPSVVLPSESELQYAPISTMCLDVFSAYFSPFDAHYGCVLDASRKKVARAPITV